MTANPHQPGPEKVSRRFVLPFLSCWRSLVLPALGTAFWTASANSGRSRGGWRGSWVEGGLYGEALRDNRRAYKLPCMTLSGPTLLPRFLSHPGIPC